ncbi:zinc metallopeptidase [Arthrobacter crystallopoietes]|nr:zinc metallopeptidase [Arthrobacter crystallopoietes]
MTGTSSRGTPHPMSQRTRSSTFARRLPALVLGLGLFLTACVSSPSQGDPDDGPAQDTVGNFVPDRDDSLRETLGDSPAECVASAGAEVRDVDPEDSPVKPWQKPTGGELVVEFETGRLSERYTRLVTEAATIWSESPCIEAVTARSCTGGANCVAIVEDGSRSRGTDGEMRWDDNGAYMESATITLYTQPLDRASDNGALATIVHEMGHTLGLDHRLERSDVMNSVTGDNTNPVPDAIDFANLVAIYGT